MGLEKAEGLAIHSPPTSRGRASYTNSSLCQLSHYYICSHLRLFYQFCLHSTDFGPAEEPQTLQWGIMECDSYCAVPTRGKDHGLE